MYNLIRPINASETEIEVKQFITRDVAPESGLIEIDSEIIKYENTTTHKFIGCIRAYSGTSAASHVKNSDVLVKDINNTDVNKISIQTFTLESGETIDYTLETPSNPGQTRVINVTHSASSLGTLIVNTVTINPGESKEFTWDENSWVVETDATGSGGITELTGDVTAGPGTGSQAATLSNTTVTPGSYTNTDLTVDAQGRITAAASGSAGVSNPMTSDLDTGNFDIVNLTNFELSGLIDFSDGAGTHYIRKNDTEVELVTPGTDSISWFINGVRQLQATQTDVSIGVGGIIPLFLNGDLEQSNGAIRTENGSVTNPSYSFSSDPDTGLFNDGGGFLKIVVDATSLIELTSTDVTINPSIPLFLGAGSLANPPLEFGSNAALYSGGASLNVKISGTEVSRFDNSAVATHTRFMLYDVDSGLLQRVFVTANDAVLGVTGRVLYIANI